MHYWGNRIKAEQRMAKNPGRPQPYGKRRQGPAGVWIAGKGSHSLRPQPR